MCRVKVSAAATHPCCLDVNKAPRVLGEAAIQANVQCATAGPVVAQFLPGKARNQRKFRFSGV
jgi:hypothetical protein